MRQYQTNQKDADSSTTGAKSILDLVNQKDGKDPGWVKSTIKEGEGPWSMIRKKWGWPEGHEVEINSLVKALYKKNGKPADWVPQPGEKVWVPVPGKNPEKEAEADETYEPEADRLTSGTGKTVVKIISSRIQPTHNSDGTFKADVTKYSTVEYEIFSNDFKGTHTIISTPDGEIEHFSKDFKYTPNGYDPDDYLPSGVAYWAMYITLNYNPIGKMAHGTAGAMYNRMGKQGETNFNRNPLDGSTMTEGQHWNRIFGGAKDLFTMTSGAGVMKYVITEVLKNEVAHTNEMLDKIDFLHENPGLRDFINDQVLPGL